MAEDDASYYSNRSSLRKNELQWFADEARKIFNKYTLRPTDKTGDERQIDEMISDLNYLGDEAYKIARNLPGMGQ